MPLVSYQNGLEFIAAGLTIGLDSATVEAQLRRPNQTIAKVEAWAQNYLEDNWPTPGETVLVHVFSIVPLRFTITVLSVGIIPDPDWWSRHG